MKAFFQYLKTGHFIKHLVLASVAAILVFWGAFRYMGSYTQHGEVVKVPDFSGQAISGLDKFIMGKHIKYEIIDSVYAPNEKSGIVIRQEPEKDFEVKHNRTIYLYVTSILPPQMVMPKLVDRSLRQATAMIESYGLKLGRLQYVNDACSNCILKQLHKGKEITAGTHIKKGSVIDLEVGKGLVDAAFTAIPDVTGLSFCDARKKILSATMNLGTLVFDKPIKDSCKAIVYRQSPANGSGASGREIDLYLTTDESKLDLLKNSSKPNNDDPENHDQ